MCSFGEECGILHNSILLQWCVLRSNGALCYSGVCCVPMVRCVGGVCVLSPGVFRICSGVCCVLGGCLLV